MEYPPECAITAELSRFFFLHSPESLSAIFDQTAVQYKVSVHYISYKMSGIVCDTNLKSGEIPESSQIRSQKMEINSVTTFKFEG